MSTRTIFAIAIIALVNTAQGTKLVREMPVRSAAESAHIDMDGAVYSSTEVENTQRDIA